MQELGTVLPPMHGERFAGWEQGLGAGGCAFWRYLVIAMEAKREIDGAVL